MLTIAVMAWTAVGWPLITGAQSPSNGAGSLSGTVFLDAGNRPASQVMVNLRSDSQQIFRSVLTDYEGHFEVAGLPEGAYEIVVEEQGCEPARVTAKIGGALAKVALALHLKTYRPPQPQGEPYSVSVRQLKMPAKARAEYQKGLGSFAKNDLSESLLHLSKATEVFPEYFEAFYQMGVAQMKLGQLGKAAEAFQKSIDLSAGRFALPLLGMGYTSYLEGKFSEAEPVLRRGLQLDENLLDAYFYLGMTLFQLNRLQAAESTANEALRRNPDYAPAYVVLSNVYGRRREFPEQVRAFDTYLKLSPNGTYAERIKEAREKTRGIMADLQAAN